MMTSHVRLMCVEYHNSHVVLSFLREALVSHESELVA